MSHKIIPSPIGWEKVAAGRMRVVTAIYITGTDDSFSIFCHPNALFRNV
jgi:hypothetical protein